ncbi:MAG TPA: AGE family epimerase/isomerase, partial [Rhizobium sp.]|nr:AGE family epimerase/isomerase [Rhizobium sp.]
MIAANVDLMRLRAEQLCRWLHNDALPIWKREGFCGEAGGFSEAISMNGKAVTAPCRGRVPPRQIYCFSEAGSRGWHGDWRTPVIEGLGYFDRVYRLPSGFYGALATREGALIDSNFDLYNQAFAILAFAHAAKALPETTLEMSARASSLLLGLKSEYAHSYAGFEEATPARTPLRSNPHMHLFEAALACEELEGFEKQTWL